jgi:hypothetical protein
VNAPRPPLTPLCAALPVASCSHHDSLPGIESCWPGIDSPGICKTREPEYHPSHQCFTDLEVRRVTHSLSGGSAQAGPGVVELRRRSQFQRRAGSSEAGNELATENQTGPKLSLSLSPSMLKALTASAPAGLRLATELRPTRSNSGTAAAGDGDGDGVPPPWQLRLAEPGARPGDPDFQVEPSGTLVPYDIIV